MPQLLWPLGIPLATLWDPGDLPAVTRVFTPPAEAAQSSPRPSFWSSRCMPCVFSLFAPARFPTILDHFWDPKVKLLGPTTISRDSFGTHSHPPGPFFGTPSPPLDPFASYWGPFDTLPGSGSPSRNPVGTLWDPVGTPLGSQGSIWDPLDAPVGSLCPSCLERGRRQRRSL